VERALGDDMYDEDYFDFDYLEYFNNYNETSEQDQVAQQ